MLHPLELAIWERFEKRNKVEALHPHWSSLMGIEANLSLDVEGKVRLIACLNSIAIYPINLAIVTYLITSCR